MSGMTEFAVPHERVKNRPQALAVQYGALPWRWKRSSSSGVQVMLITSRRRGRWKLPKGWLVEGKTPSQSAAQEAFEEAGVVGEIAKEPFGQYSCVKLLEDGRMLDCIVILFALEVRGTLVDWPDKQQRMRSWHDFDSAAQRVADSGLSKILATAQRNSKLFG